MQAFGDKRSIRRYGWALVPMDEMLAQDPYSREGVYAHVETHPWEFGGRH